MQRKNIALIGMPGAYKSTVASLFAHNSEMLFTDSDKLIEYEMSCSVQEIFLKCGEAYFRKMESGVLARLADMENIVISTGGGAVLCAENRRCLRKNAYVVWLDASPLTLFERLSVAKEKRPLLYPLTLEKLEKMYAERKKLYAQCAHIRLSCDGKTAEQTAEDLCNLILNEAYGDVLKV